MIVYYFYKITNPIGQIYIGQTNDIDRRKREYRYVEHNKNQKLIYHSLKKYSYDNHKHEVIYKTRCSSQDANRIEITLIAVMNCYWYDNKGYGLNLTRGGELSRIGIAHRSESIQKMRDSFTEERRKNIATRMSNRVISESTLNKFYERMKGKPIKNRKVFIGSEHPKTKLTESIVYNIKLDIQTKAGRRSFIMNKYNITAKIYQNIKSNISWKHVTID